MTLIKLKLYQIKTLYFITFSFGDVYKNVFGLQTKTNTCVSYTCMVNHIEKVSIQSLLKSRKKRVFYKSVNKLTKKL